MLARVGQNCGWAWSSVSMVMSPGWNPKRVVSR
jgi:hypothetical protein